MNHSAASGLRVRTRPLTSADSLLRHLPTHGHPHDVLSWIRGGEGLIGWGRAAHVRLYGADRFALAEEWFDRLREQSTIEDEVGSSGTGLVAFGSFAFADASPHPSHLIVPATIIGMREGAAWITTIQHQDDPHTEPTPPGATTESSGEHTPPRAELVPGPIPAHEWPQVIAQAVARIDAGEVTKVVLAREERVEFAEPIDVSTPLTRLAQRYREAWTFCVEGLLGATPELLVRRRSARVTSRVLAGTVRRASGPVPTDATRAELARSAKDQHEHAVAVHSVAEILRPHCHSLEVPAEPFVLELPNVFHLASDIFGDLREDVSAMKLAGELHPSAAVGGHPQKKAVALIEELERHDRGRYAGPVGWVDAHGDGDWGIALRCGQVAADGNSARLFAGGGIVAGSDPDAELVETDAKLEPMHQALGLMP